MPEQQGSSDSAGIDASGLRRERGFLASAFGGSRLLGTPHLHSVIWRFSGGSGVTNGTERD